MKWKLPQIFNRNDAPNTHGAKASLVFDFGAETTPGGPLSPDGPINDTATSAEIEFPVPWTSRTNMPIRRVPMGKMWGNVDDPTYGGPWQ